MLARAPRAKVKRWLEAASGTSPGALVARAGLFFALAALFYAPALAGGFVSDDVGYLVNNPFIHRLSLQNLVSIWSPYSDATQWAGNYAPLHQTLNALEWQLFGARTLGYHLVNLAFHALATSLFFTLLRGASVGLEGAWLGSLFFLLHPANVEAVAWISELKSVAALALAFAALAWLPRRPLLSAFAFGLALFGKAVAAFALPAAGAALLCGMFPASSRRRVGFALGLWALAFTAFVAPQMAAFERFGHVPWPLHPERAVAVRTLFAFGARYLAMAAAGYGLGAFQDPPRALSPFDPWWLAGLAAAALGTLLLLRGLRRRSADAPFWTAAAAAYLPTSQIFPFLYPMADRYLYFVLPGLIGGTILLGREFGGRWLRASGAARATGVTRIRTAAVIAGALWVALLAARTPERAGVWRSELTLALDSARHFPDGISAHLLRARIAARGGDVERAVAELRAASDRGVDAFLGLWQDPSFVPLRGDPRFRELIAEVAGRWIRNVMRHGELNQAELRLLGHAHWLRGERREALEALRRAASRPGPFTDAVRRELGQYEAAVLAGRAGASGKEDGASRQEGPGAREGTRRKQGGAPRPGAASKRDESAGRPGGGDVPSQPQP